MPLQSVLADFDDLLGHDAISGDVIQRDAVRDITLLADTIRLASSVLGRFPDMLGPQVMPRCKRSNFRPALSILTFR